MRSNYWDLWKGVAISFVMLVHVLANNSKFYSENINSLLICQLLYTAVPIFLALAGFFSAKPIVSWYEFYKNRALRILPPYLLWTFIYIVIFKPDHLLHPSLVFKDIVFGEGIVIGYFVVLLFQYILLTPLILRINNNATHFIWLCVFTIIGIVYMYFVREHYPNHNIAKFPMILIPFFVWYPFYHVGIFAAKKELHHNSFLIKHRLMFLYAVILWSPIVIVITWYLRIQDAVNTSHIEFRITGIISAVLLFYVGLAFYTRFSNIPKSPLTWLGKHSYPIFLTHILVLDLIKPYFSASLLGSLSVAFFINWLTLIAITSLLIFSLGRLTPTRFSNLVIGR